MFNGDSLEIIDKELFDILEDEQKRQKETINLIASENFINKAVRECLGHRVSNKYSEGYPRKRYYGGNDYIDKIEELCYKRALEAYNISENEWGVNVQALSGSAANVQALYGLVGLKGKILGMHLCSGGHLTHGFFNEKKKVSITSDLFESRLYKCNSEGYLDYDSIRKIALEFRPKVIICGYTSYPRDIDYKKFRDICDEVDAYLLADISHISSFVACKLLNNPFEYADVVTTTTHKTLRGPRSALIFFNKKRNPGIDEKINSAVFPSFQGGPHNNKIAAVACQLKEVNSDFFRKYAKQVLLNSKALSKYLIDNNVDIVTNGTDNHLILVDLRRYNITGSKLQEVCNAINVSLNKNTIPSDVDCVSPSGVRIGTPAITTRGAKEKDMEFIAQILIKAIKLTADLQQIYGKKLVDFKKGLVNNSDIEKLKSEVVEWASHLPLP
ncbi:serine hydroxymethyltransferase, putative [Plasmodium relictum]|uniref:Serine hydroxymethyltransferase n=1 Tax=Plasmodium relictum TaxID=85471 RepID=A0A1J1HBV3_PLARL|nr:serine hydroxymethyltransferase, putative [Plasmodium relictum]CRH02783.1 serine hydroxymethyltransferase, putative [Plasmodium relictum]